VALPPGLLHCKKVRVNLSIWVSCKQIIVNFYTWVDDADLSTWVTMSRKEIVTQVDYSAGFITQEDYSASGVEICNNF